MLIAEARVETGTASRYLVQVCRHVSEASASHHGMQARVEWSADHGVINFGWARCTLRAEPGLLILRAEAPDEEGLRWLERRVANRLKRVGGHDRLVVTWTRSQDVSDSQPRSPRRSEPSATDGSALRYPDTGDDNDVEPDRESATGTRVRVVRLSLILAVIALLVFAALHVMGGGFRGLHG
jgi:hypothetical protein